MRRLLVVSIILAGMILPAPLQAQAQEEEPVIQIRYSGGRSPSVSDDEADGPVPRLPDGIVDLTGPWVGGGSNGDIERDGGLEPGELPLLPWARELRDSRLDQEEPYTACLPMSVPRTNPYPWKFAMSYTSKGLSHIYQAAEKLREMGSTDRSRRTTMLPTPLKGAPSCADTMSKALTCSATCRRNSACQPTIRSARFAR